MKILYDGQILCQKYGGISRYFYQLYRNYKNNSDLDIQVEFANLLTRNQFFEEVDQNEFSLFLPNLKFKGKNFFIKLINKMDTVNKLRKYNYDVLHPTYYDPYFLKYIDKTPFVLTIHDMNHELFPQYFPNHVKISTWKKILSEKANQIICVSNNTKNDLLNTFSINCEKVNVVHHGINSKYEKITIKDINRFPQNFILYVGSRRGYKNFLTFLDSIAPILKNNYRLFLVCVGGNKFSLEEKKELNKLSIENKVKQVSVNDKLLDYLYQNAQIFVYPSLYEGFGFPILEAFKNRCPVVLSNIEIFKEIAKDAALFFDPKHKESIKETVVKLLENKTIRTKMIRNGKKLLKNYYLSTTIEKTYQIYKKTL